VLLGVAADALAAEFVIFNLDGPGEGFNDPTPAAPIGGNAGRTRGQQRLIAFQAAAQIWGQALQSSVPIEVDAEFDALTCANGGAILGMAGGKSVVSDFPSAPLANTYYPIALANSLTGRDLDPNADLGAVFNSRIDDECLAPGMRWYYGLDGNPPPNSIHFLPVLLHELGHGLGFQTFTDLKTGAFVDPNRPSTPDVYARLIFDKVFGRFWHQMTASERLDSANNNGQVVWGGAGVRAASGFLTDGKDTQGLVQLYAPTAIALGSSISHWDITATPNLLMEPRLTPDLSLDLDLSDELMQDIGWRLASQAPDECQDGIDKDGDGAIDAQDPGCDDSPGARESDADPINNGECTDGIDNDRDGLIDLADPGCDRPFDQAAEAVNLETCRDGVCWGTETENTCTEDCTSIENVGNNNIIHVCGDKTCGGSRENATTCPRDCRQQVISAPVPACGLLGIEVLLPWLFRGVTSRFRARRLRKFPRAA